jgi:ribosomal protein S14
MHTCPSCSREHNRSTILCRSCYLAARRAAGNPEKRYVSRRICSEPGCDKPVDARGLCMSHYRKSTYRDPVTPCSVVGCGRRRGYADGYCAAHHQLYVRHGDPLARATVQATHCAECGCERVVERDRKGKFDLCRRCFRRMKWYANVVENRAKMNASQKRVRRQTPPWADMEAIRKIYRERPQGMDVDHIIPLRGKTVSGLHVHYNLQYLPMSENRAKGATVG